MKETTLAIDDLNGRRVAVTIPTGDIVKLIADQSAENEKMVDVLWEGRTVAVYATDFEAVGHRDWRGKLTSNTASLS